MLESATFRLPETLVQPSMNQSDWTTWVRYLNNRRKPTSLQKRIDSPRTSPLRWCWPLEEDDHASAPRVARIELLHEAVRKRHAGKLGAKTIARVADSLQQWLDDDSQATVNYSFAYEAVAWADALAELPQILPDEASSAHRWMELQRQLTTLAEQAELGRLGCPLLGQLLAGELPFTLAVLLPEFPECRDLLEPASDVMSRTAVELTDGEGLPSAATLPLFRPLLASWLRCQLRYGKAALDEEGQAQFEWAATQFLRLSRPDGDQVLTPGAGGKWSRKLALWLLKVMGDDEDRQAARKTLPQGKQLGGESQAEQTRRASVYSEWAQVAVMRSAWKRNSPLFACRFDAKRTVTELHVGGELLLDGEWTAHVEFDGRPLTAVSEWEETCWTEDADVNYLELEMKLSDHWRLQRQMLLACGDRFLLLADALLGPQTGSIEYRQTLPLCEHVAFRPCEETRDGRLLIDNSPRAQVLPLSAAEWRVERSPSELQNTVAGLQLTTKATGNALYAPLWIDLHAPRVKQEPTWRRLTVARQMKIEPADQAVGFRVQVGPKQWLIYRTLSEKANRTVFGQNLVTEFICGRIDRHGDVENLVEVE